MENLNVYRSNFSATLNNIGKEVSNIMDWLGRTKGAIGESTLFELKVILNELLLNAVKHGSREDVSKSVKIRIRILENDFLYIEVEDDGEGCDYSRLLAMAHEECACEDIINLKETGRGLLIVENLCDCIKFNKKGNKVIVKKELTKA